MCCFLKRLICSTDLKSANSLTPRGKQKKFTLQGENQKKKNYRGEKQNSLIL
jgi:hypothetical protein